MLAQISGGNATYFHSDHLNWRVATSSSGSITAQQGSYPFGESWYTASTNNFNFTSYRLDPESGLDYALARYYDSSVGRFCSADPVGGQVGDPQSWNRYPYVRNDPVDITDANGQHWWNIVLDILSLVADIFSGGAATPVTALDAAAPSFNVWDALPALQSLATFGDTVHTALENSEGQQAQSPQQQPAPAARRPVYCDPGVLRAIAAAWDKPKFPGRDEAGFPVHNTADGGYHVGNGSINQPADMDKDIQMGNEKGFPINGPGATSVFHTHPVGTSGLPSTPSNNAGGDTSVGDTGSAVKNKIDIYVISDEGLARAPAGGPRDPNYGSKNAPDPWIIKGTDFGTWYKALRLKCGPQ